VCAPSAFACLMRGCPRAPLRPHSLSFRLTPPYLRLPNDSMNPPPKHP
jgi:hypothetical protein